jgi:hypothetical protein
MHDLLAQRLTDIEKQLKTLYEQLGKQEHYVITASGLEQTKAEQLIKDDIKPRIKECEGNYLDVLRQIADEFTEDEAVKIINVVAEEVERVKSQPDLHSQEFLEILQRIEAKLNEPETAVAAKLKGTLSLMPPFVNLSYETELDTENFVRKYFPTFVELTRRIRDAKKKS